MAKKRVKIELEDGEGSRYSLTIEGNVTREKALKVFELMQLIEGEKDQKEIDREINSIGERISALIESEFSLGEFTSSKLLEAYEDHFNEPIKLSVVSTYLSRFTNRGLLSRVKGKGGWIYRKIPKLSV